MEKFGVKFAPLNIPFERRVQTLCAFIWFVTIALGNFICFGIHAYLVLFTSYWHIAILYAVWMWYDKETPCKGGRRSWLVRNLPLWKYYRQYFPIKLMKTVDLNPDRNYLFGCFPHGMLCAGMFGNFANDYSDFKKLFPGLNMYLATLNMHFNSPFFRDYVLGFGAISAAKESLHYVLNSNNKGNVLGLAVGGAAESFFAKPGSYHIVLKNRKGFVKIALETGTALVPVFSFGEIDIYDQVDLSRGSLLYKFRQWMKESIGFAPCIPKGRGLLQYSFGVVPIRSPVTTVVGKPIDIPHIINPTEEDINKYHTAFIEEIVSLFKENKDKYLKDPDNTELIVE